MPLVLCMQRPRPEQLSGQSNLLMERVNLHSMASSPLMPAYQVPASGTVATVGHQTQARWQPKSLVCVNRHSRQGLMQSRRSWSCQHTSHRRGRRQGDTCQNPPGGCNAGVKADSLALLHSHSQRGIACSAAVTAPAHGQYPRSPACQLSEVRSNLTSRSLSSAM